VARYTSAAPVLFGEADEYVDGGLLANNPSDSGLTRIQSHYRSRGEKLPISLVVSVGAGKYPARALGSVDFLFVGSQGWSSPFGTSNLMELLSFAVSEVLKGGLSQLLPFHCPLFLVKLHSAGRLEIVLCVTSEVYVC